MTRGTRIRLLAFAVLSAVGIVYVAGSYLGVVDRVLGRGLHVHATLPDSGGLFEGSEVTYRGHKVGKVTAMQVTGDGVRLDLSLKEGTRVPADSPIEVHNLSAVGEQYLDIVPEKGDGPWLRDGDTLAGDAASLPVTEQEVLTDLDALVGSVDRDQLTRVIGELGTMFRGTAAPLQRMVDAAEVLVRTARENEQATVDLFHTGRTVLRTQAAHEDDIRGFATNLADLTQTLRASDDKLRTILQGGPGAVREVDELVTALEPTLPVFLSNLITVNQVMTTRLGPIEELLVSFPVAIVAGFTGTPGDGYGHINLQLNYAVPPCTEGYLPKERWRPATDLTDTEPYLSQCASGPPYNMRGTKYAPNSPMGSRMRVGTYDARTGVASRGDGTTVTLGSQGGLIPMMGDDAWQFLLTGPVERTGAGR